MDLTAKGTVAGIIYRNEDNGYTVFGLDTIDGDDITCVGNFPTLSVGAVLTVSGKVSMHSKYGEQLSVEQYTMSDPTSREGIVKYLSSGLIKGIGEVTANNIYDKFGEDTFGVIENNPMQLVRVKGISQRKAMDIANAVAAASKQSGSLPTALPASYPPVRRPGTPAGKICLSRWTYTSITIYPKATRRWCSQGWTSPWVPCPPFATASPSTA